MNTTWILVANSSEASLYAAPRTKLHNRKNKKKPLNLIGNFEHHESRAKGIELATDRPGRCGRGSFVEPTEPKEREQDVFALELSKTLRAGRAKNKFQDLIIVAPAKFHGKLKNCMNGRIDYCVSLDVIKDYTKDTPQQLISHLEEFL